MFISNPVVFLTVNKLCKQGKIDKKQRDKLLIKDKSINMAIVTIAAVVLAAYLLP